MMDWWGWVLVGWVLASVLSALGFSRWFRWLREDNRS